MTGSSCSLYTNPGKGVRTPEQSVYRPEWIIQNFVMIVVQHLVGMMKIEFGHIPKTDRPVIDFTPPFRIFNFCNPVKRTIHDMNFTSRIQNGHSIRNDQMKRWKILNGSSKNNDVKFLIRWCILNISNPEMNICPVSKYPFCLV